MSTAELEALAAKIKALTPPDQLRLAGDLLERRQARLAHNIANHVVMELGAALAIRDTEQMRREQVSR